MPRSANRTGFSDNAGALNKKMTIGTVYPTSSTKGDIMIDTSVPVIKHYTGSAWTISHSAIKNHTPSSASDTGTAGTIYYDSSYLYICTATDTWRRIAHATW